jgi:EAL domain-containing protein (putative c-di-GMP-specific phosphodiesterase class I)
MPETRKPACGGQCGEGLAFEITMAFQPIVDIATGTVWAHEALVRGAEGQPAGWVLSQVTDINRYAFDQACRVRAIELAQRLGIETKLSINFLPNAVYHPAACIRATLDAANRTGLPLDRLIFEVTEAEQTLDRAHLRSIMEEYKRQGFTTAIDDFGAGFSGLNLLADFQPDLIKLDMDLIRNIDGNRTRQAIAAGVLATCRELGIAVVAEGVETAAEAKVLAGLGVSLMQGYLFAKPAFEALTPAHRVVWPALADAGTGSPTLPESAVLQPPV